jgi:probable rRNA maturation factor
VELTVLFTDDAQIRELNRVYRGVDAVTDVLAFGEAAEAGNFVTPPEAVDYLGDVVVSYPRAVEQAAAYDHPAEEELAVLVVHGVLHLLGYDHEALNDGAEMWRVQSNALARLGIHWQP